MSACGGRGEFNKINQILVHFISDQATDPDPLGPQEFGFLDPDPQEYIDTRIRIQREKNQPKTEKKTFLFSEPKPEHF